MNAAIDPRSHRRHRFTVDEYYRMAEMGVLSADSHVELIEGEIVDMSPMGPLHRGIISFLTHLLSRVVGDRAIVRPQVPLRLDDSSEPEPDFALVKHRRDFYTRSHPTPADTLLVIELSDTSLDYDRDIKVPLYAAHGVPEVWLAELKAGVLHVFHTPVDGRYIHSSNLRAPGAVVPQCLPDVHFDLSELLWAPPDPGEEE